MKFLKPSIFLTVFLSAPIALADLYDVYFPTGAVLYDEDGNPTTGHVFSIHNNDTGNVVTVSMDAMAEAFDGYAENFGDGYGVSAASNERIPVQDFKGTTITFRENSVLQIADFGPDGIGGNDDDPDTNYVYDRIMDVDVETGEITRQILVAKSAEGKALAEAAGYTTQLAVIDESVSEGGIITSFKTFAPNVTNESIDDEEFETKGGFSATQILNDEGTSIFREEADGTVHIGENSIVLADEAVSNSGYDQIYSSSGVLELGNNGSHRTVVTGTLEIQDPTLPNHAATKRYADGIGAMSLALSMMPKAMPGQSMVTAGMGTMGGQGAIALGLSAANEGSGMSYNFGTAYNDTVAEFSFGAGVGWQF